MPTDGHYDYCQCKGCWPEWRREKALLSAMTFHERKAYRVARRALGEREDRSDG